MNPRNNDRQGSQLHPSPSGSSNIATEPEAQAGVNAVYTVRQISVA